MQPVCAFFEFAVGCHRYPVIPGRGAYLAEHSPYQARKRRIAIGIKRHARLNLNSPVSTSFHKPCFGDDSQPAYRSLFTESVLHVFMSD
jgi:hypothetical protein